jgi:hypothetical protein
LGTLYMDFSYSYQIDFSPWPSIPPSQKLLASSFSTQETCYSTIQDAEK